MGSVLTPDSSKSIDKPAIESIVVQGKSFALNGESISYRFHVDEKTGDIMSDHFGGFVTESPNIPGNVPPNGWSMFGKLRREFPELGKGDFRNPAVHLRHHAGYTVSQFRYRSHEVIRGKPEYPELPATFGHEDQVSTLVVHMFDEYSNVQADLLYSVFPAYDAIVRRVVVTNHGNEKITVERLASASIDFPHADYDIIGLRGEWTRECTLARRKVDYGIQGFASNTGFSSHFYNPFLALASSTATESYGDAWGFSLVYTGSFSAEVEQSPHGLVRTTIGANPLQLSWPLQPGERLVSPECVAVFSASGLGGMSRKFHRLFRGHLIKSKYVHQPRPPLLNSWEGLYFNFDEKKIIRLATAASELGVKLFVLDDGWFGVKHPRNIDNAGLGDWIENPAKFPSGLKGAAEKITQLPVAGSTDKLQFGIWVEPEMVNPSSELYAAHPDWAMTAGTHDQSEARNQLVLNMALAAVQEYIILAMTKLLQSAPISYVKYDHNRAIHESASPRSYHAYILGMYHVFRALTTRFPDVLWEGCGSGGGRFDPGVLHYFPQIWASDNMDGIDRISTQFGASLVYPLSSMGAHVGAVPNHCTGRTQSLEFRAHVAMMGGSFGLELDPDSLEEAEREKIPGLLALAQKVNPIVIDGDLYRLRLPGASRHPAAMVVSSDGTRAVVFAFQLLSMTMHELPTLRLQGLVAEARYRFDGKDVYSGATLMNGGVQLLFKGDYDSKVILLERL